MNGEKMRKNKNLSKLFRVLSVIFAASFIIAYMICGFFDYAGKNIVAHITGAITMSGCFITSLSFLKYLKGNKIFKLIGFLGNFGMATAYFLYIFKAISPSNFLIKSHAASSMLFDITTLMLSITTLLALIIIHTEDTEHD